jgi:hypothetical protein
MMADGGDCPAMAPRAVEIVVGDEPERWAALGFALDQDGTCTLGGVRLVCAGGEPGLRAVAFEDLGSDRPDGLPFVAAATHDRPPAGGAPRGGAPAGGAPAGGAPGGGVPRGGEPAGGAPAGGAPRGGAPPVDSPPGDLPPGDSPSADSPHPNGALAVDHVVAFTDSLDRTTGALEAAGLRLRRVRRPPEAPAPQAFLPAGTLVVEVVETGAPPSLWGLVVVVADLDAAHDRYPEHLDAPRAAVQPGRRIATVRREAGLSVALALMTPRG